MRGPMLLQRSLLGVLLVLALGLVGLGCSDSSSKVYPTPASGPAPGASSGSNYWYVGDTFGNPLKTQNANEANLANEVLVLVNQERQLAGQAPLLLDTGAEKAAKAHSEDMLGRGYFNHDTPEGWSHVDRLSMLGVTGFNMSGENIARGQTTAAQVMSDWMNSQGHKENILRPEFTHIGMGVAEGPQVHWTQVFLRRP